MKIVKTIEELKALPLGTDLYRPTKTNIDHWYYAGINPKSPNHIMLISSGSVEKITCEYMNYSWKDYTYWLDYDEACAQLLENAKKNVEIVKRIFIDKSWDNPMKSQQ